MDISSTQQRLGFGAAGATAGMVLGAQAGATADRGVAGLVVGGALGAAAGFGVGFGVGAFGTMHNPEGNDYVDHHDHATMQQPSAYIAFGATAAVLSGAAFFALGAHPSTRAVTSTVIGIAGVSMLAAALGGAFGKTVPDVVEPAPAPSRVPQPLPQHGS